MLSHEVCAVVVSYHPDAEVAVNLSKVRPQVREVVVVDNGSTAGEFAALEAGIAGLSITTIRNEENLGIAKALNQGVLWARERGYGWVMLFDQDSSVTDEYVTRMQRCFSGSPDSSSMAILVPRYVDVRFGNVLEPPSGTAGTLEAATTSGSLMPMKVFDRAGYFAEELFIDGVDYEYSLRVRRMGLIIAECAEAVLMHSPGTPTYHKGLGKKPFQTANYSPVRRYYQERNKIWVAKRYFSSFPGFCAKQFATSAKDLMKILMVEENKMRKTHYFFRGVRDGFLGRSGKLRER